MTLKLQISRQMDFYFHSRHCPRVCQRPQKKIAKKNNELLHKTNSHDNTHILCLLALAAVVYVGLLLCDFVPCPIHNARYLMAECNLRQFNSVFVRIAVKSERDSLRGVGVRWSEMAAENSNN